MNSKPHMGSEHIIIRLNPSPSIVNRVVRRPLLLMLVFLLVGAAQVLAFAPFNQWYMVFVSILPLLWAFETLPRYRVRWCAYWYGVGYWLAAIHWIYYSFTHFASTSLVMSFMLVAFFALALALLWVLLFELWYRVSRPFGFYGDVPSPKWLRCLLFAASWVALEWLRSTLFYGFPWLLIGYSFMDIGFVPFVAWLPVGGIWSLSFVVVLALAGVFYTLSALLSNKSFADTVRELSLPLLFVVAVVGGSWLLPSDYSRPTGNSLRVGLVQPSIPLSEKWAFTLSTRNLLLLQQLSEPLRDSVDVFIWPESAIAGDWQGRWSLIEAIRQSLAPATLVSGTLRYADEDRMSAHNSIGDFGFASNEQGNVISPRFYDKRKLVPFGEFMPFYDQLSWILHTLGFPANNLVPAIEPKGVFALHNMLFSPSICYESTFPRLITPYAWRSEALLNISDDGWFGASIGPYQNFQMARARAAENSRQLVRVGNDGMTALVDHQGKLIASLPRFSRDTLVVNVEGREGRTPFSFIGDWVVLLLVGVPFLLYLLLYFAWRKSFA